MGGRIFARKIEKMKLSDIATFVEDKISSNSISLADYVTTDSLLPNKEGKNFATNLPPVVCSLTHYREGDVLVANIRPYLKKVWLANKEGGASTDVLVFRVKESNKSSFLYAVLLQDRFFEYAMKGAKGSKMPRGDKEQIMRYELPTFSPQEQENIGNIIIGITKKMQLNRSINHNLEALITDIVDYEYLSNINSLPKRKIGDIASIKAGGDCPLEWSKERTEEFNIPIFSNGIENGGLYGYAKQATISKPSVTIAARGTIGFCALREANYVPIIRLLAVTPHDKGGEIYLHQILNRITFKKDGSIQQQLTVPALSCIEIPYPDSIQLALFASKVYPIVEKIRFCNEQNEKLTELRDSLLPLLMNGQVSLNYDLSND